MYEEPEKKSDNEALNLILEEVEGINKKLNLFYWVAIVSLVFTGLYLLYQLLMLWD